MKKEIMNQCKLKESLALVDLSDPQNGIHAVNIALGNIVESLRGIPNFPSPQVIRESPITSVENNFDKLLFPKDNLGRSSTYTRYVSEDNVLRTHSSAMIPPILEELGNRRSENAIIICPGICYRRDVVDRSHCGEPHQADVWIIKKGDPRLERADLIKLIELVINSIFPGKEYKANEVVHPYTVNGLEVEILHHGEWIEILECGEANPVVLKNSSLDPSCYSGLAMGIGIDRLVMIKKEIDDIRILRAEDNRIKSQMADLDIYHSVSRMPPIRQDISFSVDLDYAEEDVCEMIRDAMENDIDLLEEVSIISETPFENLPPKAVERLGIKEGQKNILARIILRSHERSLLKDEANLIRDRVYRSVNQSGTEGYLG